VAFTSVTSHQKNESHQPSIGCSSFAVLFYIITGLVALETENNQTAKVRLKK
jgi:hypothetical protein